MSDAARFFKTTSSDIGRCCKFGYKAKGIYFSYDSNFIINKNCKKLKEQ
jgi:hypothetical protein